VHHEVNIDGWASCRWMMGQEPEVQGDSLWPAVYQGLDVYQEPSSGAMSPATPPPAALILGYSLEQGAPDILIISAHLMLSVTGILQHSGSCDGSAAIMTSGKPILCMPLHVPHQDMPNARQSPQKVASS